MATVNHLNALSEQPSEMTIAILSQLVAGTTSGGSGSGSLTTETASGASSDAVTLALNTIPTAQPGHLITSEYHNSLRTAVLLIASRLGIDTTGAAGSITYPPQFLMNDAGPNWNQAGGVATASPDGANGYFPVLVPAGSRLQSLQVRGRRTGATPATFRVQLNRIEISSGDLLTLISASLVSGGDPFDINQSLSVANAGPAALEEYRTVDNTNYTYLIMGRALGVTDLAQINSITVNFSRT